MDNPPVSGQQGGGPLVACSYCKRTFTANVLERHLVVCSTKASSHRRRVPFDSSRQRLEGTEMKNYQPSRRLKQASVPPNHWRQRHDELMSAMRNARLTKRAIDRGEALPPPPPPSLNPDYVQCVYCGRRFNQTAADRHIPLCKEKMERTAMTVKSTTSTAGAKKPAARGRQ